MPILSYFAIYFVIWWLALFMVLPFGVRSQIESDEVVPGSEPGAPALPMLVKKMLAATILAAVIMAAAMWALSNPVLQEYWT